MVKLVVVVFICPCCKRVKKYREWIYLTAEAWVKLKEKYFIDEAHQYCPSCKTLVEKEIDESKKQGW